MSLSGGEESISMCVRLFNERAASGGMRIRILRRLASRTLILIYNERLLQKQLDNRSHCEILSRFGYTPSMTIDESLDRLSERISEDGDFPHEVGSFLGYPPEDVEGFIRNKGENFKLCGCWKVYGDVEKARRTFESYSKCRKFLCNKLSQGFDIYHTLKIS